MSVLSLATYVEAQTKGMPFWRLEISNWGNRMTGADDNSIAYVAAPVNSLQTLVIGPDSTADGVIVGYTDLAAFDTAFLSPTPGSNQQISMTASIHKPAVIMPGPLTLRTTVSTMFGDTYQRDGDPATYSFGGAEPLFEAPVLQTLGYFGVPTVNPAPKRVDMYRTRQTLGVDTTENLIGIFPVMGRTCKSLYFQATGDLIADIRVGGIACFVTTVVGLPVPRTIEDTVGGASIDATTGVQASITTGRPMQWISVYYTRVSGDGFINTILIATDGGCAVGPSGT